MKKNKKGSRLITVALVIFIVALLTFCGYSMAKIMDEVILKGKAEIAEPILIVENNPSIDITKTANEGVYTFKIKNYNEDNKVTETDLKYYIEILGNSDETITMELFQDDNKIELVDNKTDYINISKDEKQDKEYKIKLKYDKAKTNSLGDIIENIQVRVHTEQLRA